mgnify:CR=1 FL=1
MLNYSALRNIEQKEKTTSTLTQIDADFYRQALEHIQKLEERLHEEISFSLVPPNSFYLPSFF